MNNADWFYRFLNNVIICVCVRVCLGLTTPVVHQHHAKDVLVDLVYGDGFSQTVTSSYEEGLVGPTTQG